MAIMRISTAASFHVQGKANVDLGGEFNVNCMVFGMTSQADESFSESRREVK